MIVCSCRLSVGRPFVFPKQSCWCPTEVRKQEGNDVKSLTVLCCCTMWFWLERSCQNSAWCKNWSTFSLSLILCEETDTSLWDMFFFHFQKKKMLSLFNVTKRLTMCLVLLHCDLIIFTPVGNKESALVSSPFTVSSYVPTDAYSWQKWLKFQWPFLGVSVGGFRIELSSYTPMFPLILVFITSIFLPVASFWVATAIHLKPSDDLGCPLLCCSVSCLCYCFCNEIVFSW